MAETIKNINELDQVESVPDSANLVGEDGGQGVLVSFTLIKQLFAAIESLGYKADASLVSSIQEAVNSIVYQVNNLPKFYEWLDGSGAPASTLGTDGQFYLDTDTGKLYKKETGAWVLKLTLSGGGDGVTSYNDLTDKPTIPDELADLIEDATHRVVTDAQIADWDSREPGFSKNTGFNLNLADQPQAEAGTSNAVLMTPLRALQLLAAKLISQWNAQAADSFDPDKLDAAALPTKLQPLDLAMEKLHLKTGEVSLPPGAANIGMDVTQGRRYILTGNTNFTYVDSVSGDDKTTMMLFEVDNSGGHTITWAGITWLTPEPLSSGNHQILIIQNKHASAVDTVYGVDFGQAGTSDLVSKINTELGQVEWQTGGLTDFLEPVVVSATDTNDPTDIYKQIRFDSTGGAFNYTIDIPVGKTIFLKHVLGAAAVTLVAGNGEAFDGNNVIEADVANVLSVYRPDAGTLEVLGNEALAISEDTTPELGGNLDGKGFEQHNTAGKNGSAITHSAPGALALDYQEGTEIQVTVSANVTQFNFTNWPASAPGFMMVKCVNWGSATITHSDGTNNFKFAAAQAPAYSNPGEDRILIHKKGTEIVVYELGTGFGVPA